MSGIVSLKSMIENAVAKSSLLRISLLKGAWESITEELAPKSEPLGIKNEILYTAVENSVYLHAIEMKKRIYLEIIKRLLKGDYIKDIKYRVRKIDLHAKIERGDNIIEIDKTSKKQFEDFKTKNMSVEESIKYLSVLAKKREEYLLKNTEYKRCRRCGRMFLGTEDVCPQCRGENRTAINKY